MTLLEILTGNLQYDKEWYIVAKNGEAEFVQSNALSKAQENGWQRITTNASYLDWFSRLNNVFFNKASEKVKIETAKYYIEGLDLFDETMDYELPDMNAVLEEAIQHNKEQLDKDFPNRWEDEMLRDETSN
jgi:hypothetical protein